MSSKQSKLLKYKGESFLIPFIVVTICFALWGFANDITNPMVKAFSKIFAMSTTRASLVQFAFYGGYFVMALPAALFIRRYTFRLGLLVGLFLYALGAILFYPSMQTGMYGSFLIAYFIMTCGLSFLETSANPYILSMGDPKSATRRLNLAQAFNPIGSLAGMYIAMTFIQKRLDTTSSIDREKLPPAQFEAIKNHDLNVLSEPYIYIGVLLVVLLVIMFLIKLPKTKQDVEANTDLKPTFKRLINNRPYMYGVITQFFYVGAQIMIWTFIIQYGTRLFMSQGQSEFEAEALSQQYNILAMVIFCCFRFLGTYLLRYIQPQYLLSVFSVMAISLLIVCISSQGLLGLYALVLVSACMSIMFPTIYGLSLEKIGTDAKIGSAGLIMAILGGSILPPIQAYIIDDKEVLGFPAVNLSFIVPLISFIVIAAYGISYRKD